MRYEKKPQEDWLKINIKRQGERTVKCGKKKWIGGHWGMRASIGAKSLLAGADDCIRCEEAMLRRGTSNFLIGICAFSVLVQVGNTKSRYMLNNPTCNAKYLKRTDMAVAKLLGFGPHGRLFPENHQQLKGYCQETTTLVNQIEGFFKKCYKKEILDMANVLVYSIKSNVRQFCRKKTKKLTKLLENTPCINTVIQDNRCIVLFANNTKQLIPAKMSDQSKIRHTCCFYVESMRCSDEYLDALPCIRDNKEIMLDFVRGIFGSFIDVMCGEYNESTSRCEEIGEPPKPKTPSRKKYDAFLFVLLDLLESFQNFGLPNS